MIIILSLIITIDFVLNQVYCNCTRFHCINGQRFSEVTDQLCVAFCQLFQEIHSLDFLNGKFQLGTWQDVRNW